MATLSQTWFSCAPTHNTRRGKGSSRKAGIRAGDHGDQFVERPAEAGDTLPSKPTDNEDSDRVVGRHLHVINPMQRLKPAISPFFAPLGLRANSIVAI